MSDLIGHGYANGKIILIGEHSVVYHQPSIAVPFPATQVKVTVLPHQSETQIDCAFYTGLVETMPELLDSLKKTIELSLSCLKKTDSYLKIQIESSIPAERGMGSSAAVAVALTRGLFDFFKAPLTDDNLLKIVNEAEKIAHGNPSGLDALMTSSSTPYYFIKGVTPEPITLQMDGVLIVADTGITGQTKKVVSAIAAKIAGPNKTEVQETIYQLGHLTKQARQALELNQPATLGTILNKAQTELDFLGASSSELNHLIKTAREAGALGAKLTGGGAGGCLIALSKNMTTAKRIQKELEKNGAKNTWLYEMSDYINEIC